MAPAGGEAFLAIDLGAESGRATLGRFDGERVALGEIHRFPNGPVRVVGGLHWDILRLFGEIKAGLTKAAHETGGRLAGVGVDAWGVDFALLDRDGNLLSNPYHYRDGRTAGMPERAFARVPRAEIYRATGIQFMPINTLYQLLAMEGSPILGAADTLLLIPDLIGYWLTGRKRCEYTNATTTQLCDPATGDWARPLIERLRLPGQIFPPLVPPGQGLGPLLPEVAEEVGLASAVSISAVASHDTASAVVAVPAEVGAGAGAGERRFAYISSGTWSLVGVELPQPVVTRGSLEANFTNEGGFGGTTRFLKNVMGLWLLQECRRTWSREGSTPTYEALIAAAEAAPAGGPLVDPDWPPFLPPGDMPARIRRFCRATGQPEPGDPGATVRCVIESLALKYRWVIEQIVELTGRPVETIHVVGGGAQNDLLCRLTAGATGRPVLAGPAEATALGNLMVQAFARGSVGSLAEIRAVVRRSTEIRQYPPEGPRSAWDEAWGRFLRIMHEGLGTESLP